MACANGAGQTADPVEPSLQMVSPNGIRPYVTDGAGTMGFTVTNPTNRGRQLRILTRYADASDRQYGRDVWVPANSTLSSWFAAGPPAEGFGRTIMPLGTLLYDRSDNRERLIQRREDRPLWESVAPFARRLEQGTSVMLDAEVQDGSWQPSPVEYARADDVRNLVRAFREASGMSTTFSLVHDRFLPPAAESFDGIDHFVLATDRLADDAAGLEAVRGWVQRGGRLWVMLDRVQPRTVADLLGDALELHVLDRVGLTRIAIRNGRLYANRPEDDPLEVEEPVDFVRVLAPGHEPLHTVNGWPASFVADFGRGKVIFTALGARGWTRPRKERDPKPLPEFPQMPIAREQFQLVGDELRAEPGRPILLPADLQPYLNRQIGYAVVGRGPTLLVFGAFFLAMAAGVAILGRAGFGEHLLWLGPALALGAGTAFIVLGERSRSAVPPTVAYAQLVDAADVDEVQLNGQLAVYRAGAGEASAGAELGGDFEPGTEGLEGRVLRRVQTDLGRWHWENLDIPAGVRTGPFRAAVRTSEPVVARAWFGPDGLEGRVPAGACGVLEDALINSSGPRKLAVNIAADGTFHAGRADLLPLGQYLARTVLDDRQRDRQALYGKAFAEPLPRSLANRRLLLGWSAPLDPHFTFGPQTELVGAALWAIPLRLERTPPDTPVAIPAPFLECRYIDPLGESRPPPTEFMGPVDLRLRFQLPRSVLPLRVEQARLTVRVNAPARPVDLGGYAGAEAKVLRSVNSPAREEVEVTMDDPPLLRLDDSGGFYAHVAIGKVSDLSGNERLAWKIESLELDVRGRTLGGEGAP